MNYMKMNYLLVSNNEMQVMFPIVMAMILMYFGFFTEIACPTPIPILAGLATPVWYHTFLSTDKASYPSLWKIIKNF
jgi:hypothetical protein